MHTTQPTPRFNVQHITALTPGQDGQRSAATPHLLDVVDRLEVREVVQSLRERRIQEIEAAEVGGRDNNVEMHMSHGCGVIIGSWSTNLGMAVGLGMAARGLYDGAWVSALCGAGVAATFQRLSAAQATQAKKYSKAEIAHAHRCNMESVHAQTALRLPLDDAGPWAGL
jgi:hypothetical protein